jgi:hypothetical protein
MIGAGFLPQNMPNPQPGLLPGAGALSSLNSSSSQSFKATLTFPSDFMKTMTDAGEQFGKAVAQQLAALFERTQSRSQAPNRVPGQTWTRSIDRMLTGGSVGTRMPMVREIKQTADVGRSIADSVMQFGKATTGLTGAVGVLGGAARIIGPVGIALSATAQSITKIVDFADKSRQEQRRFAYISPSLAGNYQQSDMRQMLRDLRSGETIAASNKKLNEALDKLSDTLQPVESGITNLTNDVLAGVVSVIDQLTQAIIQLLPKGWQPEKKAIDAPPWIDWFQKLNDQAQKNRLLAMQVPPNAANPNRGRA